MVILKHSFTEINFATLAAADDGSKSCSSRMVAMSLPENKRVLFDFLHKTNIHTHLFFDVFLTPVFKFEIQPSLNLFFTTCTVKLTGLN